MSKKQQVVARSTAQAEHISLSLASCQALWITWVLEDLKHATKESPIIYCDSKSAIALTENPVFHGKSKHIRIKYHFIRDLVKKEKLKTLQVTRVDWRYLYETFEAGHFQGVE